MKKISMNTFSFDATHNGYKAVNKTVLQPAIKETCEIMLNPPAHLLEMNGIKNFLKKFLNGNNLVSVNLKQQEERIIFK